MIPGVKDYIGPDGSLSDGSHKFAMQIATGNPNGTLDSIRNICPTLNSQDKAAIAAFRKKLHASIDIILGPEMKLNGKPVVAVIKSPSKIFRISGIIRRSDLQKNPKVIFLFGDNVEDHQKPFAQRLGKGGQAAEMAGELNAVGIPTLWKAPDGADQSAYFSDARFEEIKTVIDKAFAKIKPGTKIVVPVDDNGDFNLGTGIAQLKERAPSILKYIESKIQALDVQNSSMTEVGNKAQVPQPQILQPYLAI
jgi:hypothetical protein